jgi:hypothetical protein
LPYDAGGYYILTTPPATKVARARAFVSYDEW